MACTLGIWQVGGHPSHTMNWPLSLLIGLINAILGCAGALAVASLGVNWYRIPSREGASGFFVIGMGLVGLVVGAVLGVVVARVVAHTAEANFLRGLGFACGTSTVLLLVITGVSWLLADFAPKFRGRHLEVEVEVLCPAAWGQPAVKRDTSSYVTLTADSGGRRQTVGNLNLAEGEWLDGRWKVRALVPLQTTSHGKMLGVALNDTDPQYASVAIPARPGERDFAWSSWISLTTNAQMRPLDPAAALSVRYRVQFDESEARREAANKAAEQQESDRQAAFERLAEHAPVTDWLQYVDWNEGGDRAQRAAKKIAARPAFIAELKAVLTGSDRAAIGRALLALDYMASPPAELAPALAAIAQQIEQEILATKRMPASEATNDAMGDLEVFFGKWTAAACAMHERTAVDQLPSVQRIAAAAADAGEHYRIESIRGTAAAYVGRWSPSTLSEPAVAPGG